MLSASFARGLSASLVNSSVSSGSMSLRRKFLPLLMRNGSASSRAPLMISFVFIGSPSFIANRSATFSLSSGRRQKIQRYGEDQVNHDRERADEPGRAPGASYKRCG